MECPKCHGTLQPMTFQATEVDRCASCEGIWFDAGERETLKSASGAEAIDPGSNTDLERDGKARVLCPRDRQQMVRMVDPTRPTVWFESCPICHGVFLDAGEFRTLNQDPTFWERLVRRRRHRPLI
ncbi:MAG TPA: zf-TFIIB domain-containing protein [Gemmatimonadaceae bacterium]|nr:zf-TFIIB domain-containing protein [Gemmatimonadaceae bacterium]